MQHPKLRPCALKCMFLDIGFPQVWCILHVHHRFVDYNVGQPSGFCLGLLWRLADFSEIWQIPADDPKIASSVCLHCACSYANACRRAMHAMLMQIPQLTLAMSTRMVFGQHYPWPSIPPPITFALTKGAHHARALVTVQAMPHTTGIFLF